MNGWVIGRLSGVEEGSSLRLERERGVRIHLGTSCMHASDRRRSSVSILAMHACEEMVCSPMLLLDKM